MNKKEDDTETEEDAEKNADIFAELVQLLDKEGLSVIIKDTKDDGRAALKILKKLYLRSSKQRIITLFIESNSLPPKFSALNIYHFFNKNAKSLNMDTNLLELFEIFPYIVVSIVPKLLSSY